MASPPRAARPSRRSVLRWGAALGAAAPVLSACGGMSTSGAGAGLTVLTTQFTPSDEANNLRAILRKAHPPGVKLVTGDASQLGTQIRSQAASGHMQIDLIAGLHGDFSQLGPDYLEDLGGLMDELADRHIPANLRTLAKLDTRTTRYIPWCQATYVVAARKSALRYLPRGADVRDLTYDQYLDWAIRARKAHGGKAQFGLPGGPQGLLHRFVQGHLYPSYTGGLVTTFRSGKAVRMWQYLKELWANTVPNSTTYDFMQEPLASGEVSVAWDHVARLVNAPKDDPDEWVMVPSPRGPEGRGFMDVVLGLGIPKGAGSVREAKDVIRGLSRPAVQIELLRRNSFFPAVRAEIPEDLPPAIRLESRAVSAQQGSPGAITTLPPVGLGQHDAEMSKVFRDAFTAIVLGGADIRRTLDEQARTMQAILDETKAPCWAPDPRHGDTTCVVG